MNRSVIIGIAGLIVSGCQGGGGVGSDEQRTATVNVGVVYIGGPPRLSTAPVLLAPGTVHLKRDGGASYTVKVTDGRRTAVKVLPGRYRATAKSGDAQCFSTTSVAKGSASVDITVLCSVK